VRGWAKASLALSGAGALALSALVWLVGPHFGLPITARAWATAGILLLWIAAALTGRAIASRRGRGIEDALRGQADEAVMDASAARRGAVTLIRNNLLAAIGTLKSSRLGRGALYELPWYMMIGHTAAGKSTALLQSGLTFPFAEQGVPGGVQGVGGTRNCDWFLSTEGILLDTAGRYATEAGDRDEWVAFLRLLRRYRSRAPVNGVLVATSLPELVGYRSETFATYVRQIRERVNEIEDVFELRVPIYLIFTKLDLLGGFSQFFEGLPEEGRGRVWGATLPHDLDAGFDICHEAGRQCELLYQGLRQMGEEKLAMAHGVDSRPAFFAFPLEFHALKSAVVRLMELLYEEDPYHARPLLRGFYFTSAIQSGEPHIAAAERVSGQFGLSRNGFKPMQQAASNGYFLTDLFREVVFPDQYLIQRQSRPRANRVRFAAMMAGAGALAVSVAALSQSWAGNRDLLASVGADISLAGGLIAKESVAEKLSGLMALQKRLEALQKRHAEGMPLEMGLYQGGRLEAVLKQQYYAGIRLLMLDPLQEQLEGRLLELVKNPPSPAPSQSSGASNTDGTGRAYQGQSGTRPPVPVQIVMPLSVLPPTLPRSASVASVAPPPPRALDEESKKRADEGYDALKTYLMLADRPHLDTVYLAASLPRFWLPWLNAQRGDTNMGGIEADALKAVYFYVEQFEARTPGLPQIRNNPLAVDEARLVLKNAATPRPVGSERVYIGLKGQAVSKFPALDIARILGGKDSDILGGQASVPGVFTREAYEKFMKDAIAEASRSQARNDDWVLAAPDGGDTGQESTSARVQEEVTALYRAEYAGAWMQLLQNAECVARPGSVAEAVKMIERLSDPQHSPLKVFLQRVSYETSWDAPPTEALNSDTLQNAAAAAQNAAGRTRHATVAQNAATAVGTLRAVAVQTPGSESVHSQFAAIHALSGSSKEAAPVLVGYLERLGRLRGQLYPAGEGSDPGTSARRLAVATLDGSGSEFVSTLQYVDGTLLPSVQDHTFRDILRPLLVRPITQSYAALLLPVEQAIDEAWRDEVLDDWQALASKYPFSRSKDEARIGDITQFAGPGGTLAKFIDEHMKGLVARRGNQFMPRTWADMGIRLDPRFTSSAARLLALGSMLARAGSGEASRFELVPLPNPALTEYVIEIDGQKLTYRNGPQSPKPFVWPRGDALGASIRVTGISGETSTVSSHAGRMGLVRLFDESQRTLDAGNSAGQLEWRFQSQSGPQSVKVRFQMSGGINPIQFSGLTHVSLPKRVTQHETENIHADQFLPLP
jgi:type VI secretion system protein ImpL